MQISCPQCSAQYNVDEARIPPQGVSIKCPRCQNTFIVHQPGSDGAVALPGAGRSPGAVPLPGAGPGAGGGIPLPGQGGGIPLPGQGGGGIPLPGSGGGGIPLPGQGGGVPLPGSSSSSPASRSQSIPLPGSGGIPLPGQGSGMGGAVPSMEDIFGGGGAPSAPAPAPASIPGNKSLSMNDIFGDSSGSGGDSRPQHPFHGTNSVRVNANTDVNQGGGDLFDFIDGAGQADAMPRVEQYSIRKRSGRVLGPFDAGTVLTMFHKGELLGSEEASVDGVTWRALAQIPAFSNTIQQAMASALAGLDDLPVPKGSGFEDLPAPRQAGMDDLPVPRQAGMDDLPVPRKNKALAAAQEAFPELGTEALRDAERAKDLVEKKRRARKEGGRAFPLLAALATLGVIAAAGVALQFVTPYGYFGYKLVFPDKPVEVVKKPDVVVEAPPPPLPSAPDQDFGDLLRQDSYIAYRHGSEQAGRTVDAGKAMTPFPESGKKAAAQQARFLGYLVAVEDLGAFVAPLKAALTLAGGDDVAKAIGEAALAYSDRQWDKGLAALGPFKDPARGLDPLTRAEVLAWSGLGKLGKGDDAAAVAEWDEALTASTRSLLALYLQARQLSVSGAPDAGLEYCEKVLAQNPTHPRASILKGRLLTAKPETLEAGRQLLVEMSEGKMGEAASPTQRAQAYMGRADLAIAARQNAEAVRYLQKAVEIVPQNRNVRLQVAETALKLHDYNVAREHGKKLLEMNADDVEGTIAVARAKMGTRDTLAAYTDLQAAARKVPDNALAAYWFGVAAREMSKPKEANEQFEKAAKLDPKRADPVVDLMTELIEQGKLDEALRRGAGAEEAISAGDRYKVRSAKAYAFTRKRAFADAEKELKAALSEAPADNDVRARHASLLVAQGKLDAAEKAVDGALALDAKNVAVLVAAGDVKLARGDAKGALERYEEAMAIAPNAHQPYLHAAVAAVELKDQQRAKGFADTAGQLRSGVTDQVAVQALVLKASDPKQGARLFQQAIDQSPLEPGLSYQLGLLNSQMGQPLEAADALKRAVQLDPVYVDALLLLGKVNRDLSRAIDARTAFEDCVRIEPKRVECWVNLADLLAQSNKDGEALKAYDQAVAADPKNATTTCAFGETLVVRMGDEAKMLKRGTETLERCVKLNPKHPTAWKNLGNAYKTTGKKKEALRSYKEHLEVNPGDEENSMVRDYMKEVGG